MLVRIRKRIGHEKWNLFFSCSSFTLLKTISWFLTHMWRNQWVIHRYRLQAINGKIIWTHLLNSVQKWITLWTFSYCFNFGKLDVMSFSWCIHKRGMFKASDKLSKIVWCLCCNFTKKKPENVQESELLTLTGPWISWFF